MKWTNRGHEYDQMYNEIEKRPRSIYLERENMEHILLI